MDIAVLGPKGTFSDRAYLDYDRMYSERHGEHLNPVYCATIDDVFEHVSQKGNTSKLCDMGIVPIENTLDGYVLRTLDLLLEKNIFVIEENMIAVQFFCVGNASSKDNIKKLYVQFKANGQCRNFISSLNNSSIITTESNMDSYYKIGNEKGTAAIVPSHIANGATNEFIKNNVTDSDNNHTRFVIFKRGDNYVNEISKARDIIESSNEHKSISDTTKVRIPVCIMPACDRPGVLYEIVKIFYENQINLISIISRPTKEHMGHYNFYIEIDGLYNRLDTILEAIEVLKKTNYIKILGIYNENK